MAIQFMSGEYNIAKMGNSVKNTRYSALYTKSKSNSNKLSQLMFNTGPDRHDSRAKTAKNNFNPSSHFSNNSN